VPLQESKDLMNTTQLKGVNTDLHILLTGSSSSDYSAQGLLYLDSPVSDPDVAVITISFSGDQMTFSVNGKYTEDSKRAQIGKIYLYNKDNVSFSAWAVGGGSPSQLKATKFGQGEVLVADVSSQKVSFFGDTSIVFT